MSPKHLLVHVDSSNEVEERLNLAVAIARRFGARLTGLFAEADTVGASLVGRRSPGRLEEAAAAARETFSSKVAAAGVDSEWWPLAGAGYADLVNLTAACCRYVDLAIFGQHDPERSRLPADLVEQVLLECGRPLLVVPSVGHHPDVGKRVAVGWNSSRESARAVGDGLPLLAGAEFVGVLAFQQPSASEAPLAMPPANIVAHLALHGIAASYQRVEQDDSGIGVVDSLLNYAFSSQADLIIVGARAEGFPVRHLSATTREFLRVMVSPLLLSA
ncbi:MAG TPA: universal stress protein [Anaeromyxobacteraceae bacterium]|nr:universal stress protein [Anaeromyxobacteraceae bacterium]